MEKEVNYSEQPPEEQKSNRTLFIVTILFIGIILVTIFGIKLTGDTLTITIVIESAFYITTAIMLRQSNIMKGIIRTEKHQDDKIVIQQVPIIKEVKVPVIKEVPVDRPVYIDRKVPVYVQSQRKKLNIPKYDFLGSSQTQTYHTRFCRLGKLIKKKYKISNNDESYFKKHKFAACKVCIQKIKKI